MKTPVYDVTGKEIDQTDLAFGKEVNYPLLAQSVRVYLSNQRRSKAKAKTRGEVDRTKAKWFRQKGTGRARHGSRSAPIFVGGGVAHGPRGNQNWRLKLSKSMRKQALINALKAKLSEREIFVVKDLEGIKSKTKDVADLLKKISQEKKTLLVLDKRTDNIVKATRNIPYLKTRLVNVLNVYDILTGGKILLTKGAINFLLDQFKKGEDAATGRAMGSYVSDKQASLSKQ